MSEETAVPVKLNIGSGPNPMEGFISVDTIKFNDDIQQWNAGQDVWPHEDNSVDEVHCSHMIEHLNASERIHFINELYRVLKPKAKATIIAPHWNSNRAYGDLTHQWPPVCEMWFSYLDKAWRAVNAPHSTYNEQVDFEYVVGGSLHPALLTRNPEYVQDAIAWKKEAFQDIHGTITKR